MRALAVIKYTNVLACGAMVRFMHLTSKPFTCILDLFSRMKQYALFLHSTLTQNCFVCMSFIRL